MSAIPITPTTGYTLTGQLPSTSFEVAKERTVAALAGEGFGVLTEIDVQATMNAKLGVQTRPYLILGACNPQLALDALSAEPGIGALLPCNVVLSGDDDGGVVVSAIDPVAMFSVVGRPDVGPLADEVRTRLERVILSLSEA